MVNKPFEIMRWESPNSPTLEALHRMLTREGLQPEQRELSALSQTPEMRFSQTAVQVLVSGKLQFSFPGYGVIELEPGDILEINPDVLHDIIVSSSQTAIFLQALRH